MKFLLFAFCVLLSAFLTHSASAGEYALSIKRQTVTITGRPVEKITINGGIPGPTLRFKEGEDVVIRVTNHLDEDSSVHWHGLILPGEMDGVPGFNGFPGIRPGETFTYRFTARQAGTYWYHAHSIAQEQDGHYGSIIIEPRGGDPIAAERDYVVLLSDFHEEDGGAIFSNLKMSADYYQYARRTVFDFFNDVERRGWSKAWSDATMWGSMRMLPTDLSDVSGYTFLINGKSAEQNWTGLFRTGERVRLRFINASAMSVFDVRIPGLSMRLVQADGQDVEPIAIDEFRFGPAETYDVVVTPKTDDAYTIAAEPIDRTGFALGTLAPREGMRGPTPAARPRALLTMADMGMGNDAGTDAMPGMNHASMNHAGMPMDHSAMKGMTMDHAAMAGMQMPMDHSTMSMDSMQDSASEKSAKSGWAEAGTPDR
ncbi:MAG: copper resistance system multicopper oxidase, partial [Parvibaculaceae bacterium]